MSSEVEFSGVLRFDSEGGADDAALALKPLGFALLRVDGTQVHVEDTNMMSALGYSERLDALYRASEVAVGGEVLCRHADEETRVGPMPPRAGRTVDAPLPFAIVGYMAHPSEAWWKWWAYGLSSLPFFLVALFFFRLLLEAPDVEAPLSRVWSGLAGLIFALLGAAIIYGLVTLRRMRIQWDGETVTGSSSWFYGPGYSGTPHPSFRTGFDPRYGVRWWATFSPKSRLVLWAKSKPSVDTGPIPLRAHVFHVSAANLQILTPHL